MRVSEHFSLGRSQAALDFVDVDVYGDTTLFIDPRAIERLPSDWGQLSLDLLRHFFERVLAAIRENRRSDGLTLLAGLGEPNQTHLGLSTGVARGSGIGKKLARDLWKALSTSEAARSGLLEHLEDTALLIEGISVDRISDIATNVIREPLISYTQEMCDQYDIPRAKVGSGSIWDWESGGWEPEHYEDLPVTARGPLLLVPKVIVRRRLDLDPGEYYRHYILRHLMDQELQAGTALVHTLKSGRKRVYKKDVHAKAKRTYRNEKQANTRVTQEHPGLLNEYRRDKARAVNQIRPLALAEFPMFTGADPPNWKRLLSTVTRLKPGNAAAAKYHRQVEALLTATFYPTLVNPKVEAEIHQGRKRVDIRYTNTAASGFFRWAQTNYAPVPYIFVECKNYSVDLGNDALDQLSGRFSKHRGMFGLLVCRAFKDKQKFVARCRDTAADGRGFVLVLDDDDLTNLLIARRDDDDARTFTILSDRFGELVS